MALQAMHPQPVVAKSLLLSPGKIVGLEGPPGWGLTRVGLSLLAGPSQVGTVVAIDVRGWLSPMAAWEEGVMAHRLVVIRCVERRVWAQVMAAVLEGVAAVYAEVPSGIGESELRRVRPVWRCVRCEVNSRQGSPIYELGGWEWSGKDLIKVMGGWTPVVCRSSLPENRFHFRRSN
jgi:hypothetical protein